MRTRQMGRSKPAIAGTPQTMPDFLIIGAMKSGTTSLYRWLGDREDVFVPATKEPNFFSDDRVWRKGLPWYASLFAQAGSVRASGEASVGYTGPDDAAKSARRIAQVLPHARLLYIVRDPIERLRSHYRHEVQRGRERRPLSAALFDPRNPYVAWSRYHSCLEPYLDSFPSDQLLVVPFEELVKGGRSGWRLVLAHLNLPYRDAPFTPNNVTAQKQGFTRLARRLWDAGVLARAQRLPAPIRRIGRGFLFSDGDRYRDLLATSEKPIATAIRENLADQADQLAGALGWHETPWRLLRDD